jgi:hypothetical protein
MKNLHVVLLETETKLQRDVDVAKYVKPVILVENVKSVLQ